jgi:hypothetical protein
MFMNLGFAFHEVMEGSIERVGERFDRAFRFEVDVATPKLVARVAMCDADGFLHIDGLAKRAHAHGRLELSPVIERRIRYVLDFVGDDGKRYQFDGSKSIARYLGSPLALLKSWTTLPGEVREIVSGELWGRARLRFHLRRDLRALVGSVWVGSPRVLAERAHA